MQATKQEVHAQKKVLSQGKAMTLNSNYGSAMNDINGLGQENLLLK
jgi:hypothetical protein